MATVVRKSAYNTDKASLGEYQVYMDGITAMIADGSYATLVSIHTDMSHNMHTMGGSQWGTFRFLAWHRAYLVEMEAQLQASSKNPKAYVPYWDWLKGGIPKWMDSFKPQVPKVKDVSLGKTMDVTNNRTFDPKEGGKRGWPPKQKDIDDLLALTRYDPFTSGLESYPHNAGHRVLGDPMTSLRSPSDPMFWMHHSAIDRVWAAWQKGNGKGKEPTYMTDDNKKMDPWSARTLEKLTDISKLGYSYDSDP